MHNQVISDLQGEGGIVKNHFNTVIIIYMSIFNISFPVNLQPADKSSKPSNMKSDFTSTAKDSSPKETIAYICGLRARIECEPISEHSTRRDRVTNIGYRLFGGGVSLRTKTTFLPLLYVLEVSFPLLLLLPFYAPDEDTGFHF